MTMPFDANTLTVSASLFCLFGWLANDGDRGDGWTDIVTVVKVWGYSFGVTVIILLVCEYRSPHPSALFRVEQENGWGNESREKELIQ
jgi:hypothetical protein